MITIMLNDLLGEVVGVESLSGMINVYLGSSLFSLQLFA